MIQKGHATREHIVRCKEQAPEGSLQSHFWCVSNRFRCKLKQLNSKMEFLTSAYDSDEGNNLDDKVLIQKSLVHKQPEISKRKKKLDISFLPKEIQDALVRGSDANDDSDDEVIHSTKSKFDKLEPKLGAASTDPLLRALPAPKQQPLQLAAASFGYSEGVNIQKPSIEQKSALNLTLPTLPSSYPLVTDLQDNYSAAADSCNTYYTGTSYASSSEAYYDQAVEDVPHVAESSMNRKKREREVEQQLMAGDTSVLQHVQVKEVKGFQSWDARAYSDQQAKEAMIMKTYTDGSSKSMQPTKAQTRKHQLTSLALKAAQTEIALMDAKGQRMKTKSQTQSKYGW
jgi:hypothetical protein